MRSPYFQTSCLLPLLACALVSFCLAHSELPRGVHPSFTAQYSVKNSASFSCGDGSSISWERVNDDHCDCTSGADEPGTSGMQGSSAAPHFNRFCFQLVLFLFMDFYRCNLSGLISCTCNHRYQKLHYVLAVMCFYVIVHLQPVVMGSFSATTGDSKDNCYTLLLSTMVYVIVVMEVTRFVHLVGCFRWRLFFSMLHLPCSACFFFAACRRLKGRFPPFEF
jgi:hypothetical protein